MCMVEYSNRELELGCQLQVASAERLEIDRQPHSNKSIQVNCLVAVDVNLMDIRLSCSLS